MHLCSYDIYTTIFSLLTWQSLSYKNTASKGCNVLIFIYAAFLQLKAIQFSFLTFLVIVFIIIFSDLI